MATITKKQKLIYDYIVQYISKYGYAPSLFEIRDKAKINTVSTAHGYISRLIKAGLLKRARNVSRSIELVKTKATNMFEIPLVGAVTCGQPIEAIEMPGTIIEIPRDNRFQESELYALKAKGNSMINDCIFDGDILIIKKQEWADDGDTAVAIIDDNEATLKKYYKEKGRIRLQPANPAFNPIYRKNVEIRGIVIKVTRDLKQ